MPYPTLIVPGLHGSNRDHWQSWWLVDHADAVLVQQADWSNPDADAWLAALEGAVLDNPGALIVAHSLGAVLTARLCHSHTAPLVSGALLVAPADIERAGELHARSYEFGIMPQDPLPFPSLVVASHDDPYMQFDKAVGLGKAWGSQIHDLGHAGHVNVASGFGRWINGYALADRVIARPATAHIAGAVHISR